MKKLYSPEFKSKVINGYLRRKPISELAQEHNLSRTTIYDWIDKAQGKEDTKDVPINLRTVHDLKVRCQRLETIIEILKSAPCCPSAPLSEKFKAIIQMSAKYNVNILCESLDVAKGSYYNHIKRNKNENTLHAQKVKELTPIIEKYIIAATKHMEHPEFMPYSRIEDITLLKILLQKSCRKMDGTVYEEVQKHCMKQVNPEKKIYLIKHSLYLRQTKYG